MTEETCIVITALVDDRGAAEEVLRSLIERELPGARVFQPGNLPERGFELAIIIPAAMSLTGLKERVAAELARAEILYAKLHLDVLDEF